ncbi:unnamed protein product [Zymoseptoria tritici ST99CH_3D7]|uniref:Uncharacterized protein n=2 Tax=Zymoseptoria tritici TaxID=1047171 RepID=F9XIH6_ZYMTI|nr:uncharacterized protein MYCGRDRAFT_95282 [Zymoseptoria tritici IPO323]EGP85287.1 hypothetical protein MYCGRDRAFT_95282 [Zymoseptoria tritici IPO323]SMQ53514.1 unnamed protein product [Zymoseptoria tritici ST99CH_3D7]
MANTNQGLGLQIPDDEPAKIETDVPPPPTSAPIPATNPLAPVANPLPPASIPTTATGSNKAQKATTFPKLKYSTLTPTKLRFVQCMDTMDEATDGNPPTSPSQTTLDQDTACSNEITKHISTCSEPTTTRFMDSQDEVEVEAEAKKTEVAGDALRSPSGRPISPERAPLGNLHKRRASRSPEKFNTGRFEPLALTTTAPPAPDFGRPAKRGRTENRVEIIYDTYGKPTLRKVPAEQPRMHYESSDTPLPRPKATDYGIYAAPKQTPQRRPRAPPPKQPFNLIDAIAMDAGLSVIFTSYLNLPSLISLYAISKRFYYEFNLRATAFILASMRTWAPNADKIFPWRCYHHLCIKDPTHRQKAVPSTFDPSLTGDISRDVPSIRWLQMVTWRHGVVRDMIITLASQALRVPKGTADAIQRMWFIMDLPLNAHRLATMRNAEYISNDTILHAAEFFIKVDMAFTDPESAPIVAPIPGAAPIRPNRVGGNLIGCKLREVLLAERTMTCLWRVLKGWSWDTEDPARPMRKIDIFKLYMRHRFRFPIHLPPNAKDLRRFPIMGEHYDDILKVGVERVYQDGETDFVKYSRQPAPLIRPDQLVIGESVRRELNLQDRLLEMVLSGFATEGGKPRPVFTYEELCRIIKRPWEVESMVKDKRAREIKKIYMRKKMQSERAQAVAAANALRTAQAAPATGTAAPGKLDQLAAYKVPAQIMQSRAMSGPVQSVPPAMSSSLLSQQAVADATDDLQAGWPGQVPSIATLLTSAKNAVQSAHSTTIPGAYQNNLPAKASASTQTTKAAPTQPPQLAVETGLQALPAMQPALVVQSRSPDVIDSGVISSYATSTTDEPRAAQSVDVTIGDTGNGQKGKGKQRATEEEIQAQQASNKNGDDERDNDAMEVEFTGKANGKAAE